MVSCFARWKKKPKTQVAKKSVGFLLDAPSPTRKSVKNVLIQKNRKLLVKILVAWSQYVQSVKLKILKKKEKSIMKELMAKK
jgi:hypothetical protein